MQLNFSQRAEAVVTRSLKQSDDPNALLIATCDVVGELGEVWDLIQRDAPRDATTECGDVIWGLVAVCIRLGIPVEDVLTLDDDRDPPWMDQALSAAFLILDQSKKVARDAPIRSPDLGLYLLNLRILWRYIRSLCDPEAALEAVDRKLRARYPDGFSAERSIDRQG